jgi:hypothetical protein
MARGAVLPVGLHEVGGSGLARPHVASSVRAPSFTVWGDCYTATFGVAAERKFKFLHFHARHKALQENRSCLEYCESNDTGFHFILLY